MDDAVERDPETLAAEEAAREEQPGANARQWLLSTMSGTLCTTSCKRGVEGYPFGSVVPFALTRDGRPVILIARIATHTANLKADPRGSLFVHQPHMEGDPQSGWRVTLMGEWEEVASDDPELPEIHARYAQRVPSTSGYLRTHDFSFWRMKAVRKARYIAGFGKICWLDGREVLVDPAGEGIGEAALGAIAHMNEDHAHNMVEMIRGFYGVNAEGVEMTGLERDGFFVKASAPDRLFFLPFGRDITATELRKEVVRVLVEARGRVA